MADYSPDDLRAIRNSFGFSQAHFSRLLRIDKSTYHNWESGRTAMPAIAITALQMLELMREHNQQSRILMEWIDQC